MSRRSQPSTIVTPPRDSPATKATRPAAAQERTSSATTQAPDAASGLSTRLRLADRSIFDGTLGPERHRSIHLGLLHGQSDGYVEIAAGRRPPGGKLRITTRKDAGHFLPGGGAGGADAWLQVLLELAVRHYDAGEEVFVGPAVRRDRAAAKAHVTHTNWLWIDVDGRDGLAVVKRLLRRKAPHLVIESAGSGGVHCYWRLRAPLRAHIETSAFDTVDWPGWLTSGASGETIERAHERLIYALGYEWRNGSPTPTVADGACKDRSRVMRLAGTVNGKTGDHARIMWADFALPPWPLRALIGDLPDPPKPAGRRAGAPVSHDDPYKRIAPVEYFHRLAGIEVPRNGLVSCPNPAHADSTPSCHVGRDAGEGWCCHGCGAAGAIYDLASVLLGGPTGRWLRGEQFRRARNHVRATFGDAR